MPAFNSCELAMATWHRNRKVFSAFQLGSHCQSLTQGTCLCVCGGAAKPQSATTPRLSTSNSIYNEHVGVFLSFSGFTHSVWAVCKAGGSGASSGSVSTRHAHRHGNGTSAWLPSPPHPTAHNALHVPRGSWGLIQEAAGLEPIWSHNK